MLAAGACAGSQKRGHLKAERQVKVVDGKKEHRGKNLPRTFVRTEDGSGHKANGGPGRL
jgi:hypothetical protein